MLAYGMAFGLDKVASVSFPTKCLTRGMLESATLRHIYTRGGGGHLNVTSRGRAHFLGLYTTCLRKNLTF